MNHILLYYIKHYIHNACALMFGGRGGGGLVKLVRFLQCWLPVTIPPLGTLGQSPMTRNYFKIVISYRITRFPPTFILLNQTTQSDRPLYSVITYLYLSVETFMEPTFFRSSVVSGRFLKHLILTFRLALSTATQTSSDIGATLYMVVPDKLFLHCFSLRLPLFHPQSLTPSVCTVIRAERNPAAAFSIWKRTSDIIQKAERRM